MKLLLETGSANGRVWEVGPGRLAIGRGERCEIRLDDAGLDEIEAHVSLVEEVPFVENFSGSPTVRLQDEILAPASPRPLRSGDRLEVGDFAFRVLGDDDEIPQEEESEAATESFEPEHQRVVGELCELILRTEDRQAFFDKIIDSVFRLFDVKRAFLALRDPDTGELEHVASGNRETDAEGDGIPVSDTILKRTLEEGESQFFADAMAAADLADAKSVLGLSIRSVLCVPLGTAEEPRGVIYADNRSRPASFTETEHAYLQMIGRFAGLVLDRIEARERRERRIETLEAQLRTGVHFLHASPQMDRIVHLVERYANIGETVLLSGASGTGKELVARSLHGLSDRREGPFVPVNCAALPAALLERELFGHEKGAFTGAVRRSIGKFEAAHGGTLFLDEIGEMSPAGQAALLRVLDGQPFTRVGGNEPIHTDTRILAATNRDLEVAVENHTFRRDLYFRIRVLSIEIPPLRERPEDIRVLAEYFLKEKFDPPPAIDEEVMRLLLRHDWPGNVRELRNVVLGAGVCCRGDRILPRDIPRALLRKELKPGDIEPLEDVVTRHVLRAVRLSSGNIKRAASALGVSRGKVYKHLRQNPPDLPDSQATG